MHRPTWYQDGGVVVSSAPTCGINKDGLEQYVVDASTGIRDAATIDDQLAQDVTAILDGGDSPTLHVVPVEQVIGPWRAVPTYFDTTTTAAFEDYLATHLSGWSESSIGELMDRGWVMRRDGHGSPSLDQRVGSVPYIKVSDLRAGLVNINPTNRVPVPLAHRFWRGTDSGLRAFDLLCPERASKNIGDFCVLLPGQEQIVLTREVIVLRSLDEAPFDSFYLLWALTLEVVRREWDRLIFMQTNREDVGHRYKEIRIPIPPTEDEGRIASEAFRSYYQSLAHIRTDLSSYLRQAGDHHFFVGVADEIHEDEDEALPEGS